MTHLAEHDPLTGLRNRRGFRSGMEAAIAFRAALSLLICDLDNFKRVNDSLGHDAGDRVLEAFAGLLRACTRTRTSRRGWAARSSRSCCPTRTTAPRWRSPSACAAPCASTSPAIRPRSRSRSASPDGPKVQTAGALMRAANRALYAAKHLGRDRWSPTTPRRWRCSTPCARPTGPPASSSPPPCCWPRRSTCATSAPRATPRRSGARGADRARARLGPGARRARARGGHPARHRQARDLRRDPAQAGPARAHEWDEMRRHPELGARILEHANLRDIAAWVLAHHERVDGAATRAGWRATTSPRRRASWRSPTPTRR